MSALAHGIEPFRHLRLCGGRLILSVCMQCGLVVAGSPRESILHFAEEIHVCPVYLSYYRDR